MSKNNEDSLKFWITTIIAIIAIIGAIVAAGLGAYWGVTIQNDNIKQNTAKLLYDDIDNLNWTLDHLNQMIIEHPNSRQYIFTPIYPENGIFYSARSDIAALDYDVARNITIFYTDIYYAEEYRKAMNSAIEQNKSIQYDVAYSQFQPAIQEAYDMRSQLLTDMQKRYNIPENTIKNRFH